jgi:Xaa-Pro aminopeptidase
MNSEALAGLGDFFKDKKLTAALFSNPATITWLTGYAPPIQTGSNPFEGGPALGWWRDGNLTLVLSDMESGAARAQGVEARDYVAYSIDDPVAGFPNQALALKELLGASAGLKGNLGVELNFLPATMLEVIKEALPSVKVVPLDGSFDLLHAVKTPDEIERIRASLKLCDLAQAETKRLIQPGVSEIEIWGKLKSSLEVTAGCRLPLLADFVAGDRTAEIGGLPGNYILSPGDAMIADIVPRLNGYWGDNAGTHFVGEPSTELKKMYQIVLDTLRKGIDAIKPGVRACDLDKMLRDAIQGEGYSPYPHHSGHGLGTSYHEEPRIVPYNTMQLQPGMVIAIEPGIYVPNVGGVRLEDVMLVTYDGCEVLTKHLGN